MINTIKDQSINEKAIQEFLRKGGKITKLPYIEPRKASKRVKPNLRNIHRTKVIFSSIEKSKDTKLNLIRQAALNLRTPSLINVADYVFVNSDTLTSYTDTFSIIHMIRTYAKNGKLELTSI